MEFEKWWNNTGQYMAGEDRKELAKKAHRHGVKSSSTSSDRFMLKRSERVDGQTCSDCALETVTEQELPNKIGKPYSNACKFDDRIICKENGKKYIWTVEPMDTTIEDLYNELILAVANKYPNETRHETALRIIMGGGFISGGTCEDNTKTS